MAQRLAEWLRLGLIAGGVAGWTVRATIAGAGAAAISVRLGLVETGFTDKSLWDWFDVLGVPLAAAVIAASLSYASQRAAGQRAEIDRELNTDRAREATLRAYLDRMTDLIINKGLQHSTVGATMPDGSDMTAERWAEYKRRFS